MMISKLNALFFRSTGFVAILLILLVLTVQYAGAWYWLEMISISKENELQRHLEDLGQVIEPQVADEAVEMTETAFQVEQEFSNETPPELSAEESPVVLHYLERIKAGVSAPFEEFARRARLTSLTLIDEEGRVLFSTAEPDRALVQFDFVELDRAQFRSALAGHVAGSPAYKIQSSPLKRVYVPVFEQRADPAAGRSRKIAAVLCLTAGRDYLGEIDHLSDNVRLLSTLSTFLILLIGWMVYHLLTRQRAFERRVAHADRLTSLGTLAAGFAHEVRNPLEIISACAEDLERTLHQTRGLPGEALESCRDILEEVERLNRLVSQFLQYSKPDTTTDKGKAASVAESLSSALGLLKHAAEKRGISIVATGASIPLEIKVPIAGGNLRQVIINLVMNAIQATPEGGRIEIEAEIEPKRIRLRFVDSGPGIPPSIRARIFEPFFTTRREGSGLGLAISHQLAHACGGDLEYEERPGKGACFILSLPRLGHDPVAQRGMAAATS